LINITGSPFREANFGIRLHAAVIFVQNSTM
jgi:hypothetical protein